MKILMVNKFHYICGGSETYYFALKNLLEEKGHTVIEFSMKDERNLPSEYEEYFVENVDYNADLSFSQKVKAAKSIIYSKEAKKKFEKLVIDTKPDIVHLHLFQHQISPSILDVIRKYQIPTVYTAHELKMICPNYKMLCNGQVCEKCKGHKYTNCLKNKCVKNSYSKSLINVVEEYFHTWRKSYDAIDVIITPSDFYRRKFIEFGVDENRVVHIPNFLDRDTPQIEKSSDSREYFLYLGRLSEEKGILTLVKACHMAGVKLYVVGRGSMDSEIKEYISSNNIKNVEMLGFKSGQDLINLVGNSKAVVLPSEWYENGPYSAIEALQLGIPLIGADIGGISELISGNGYLFEAGNVEKLKDALERMAGLSDEEYKQFEDNSGALFDKCYSKEIHYAALFEIYKRVIGN